ncbi:N-acetylmuramoyl-L-alanine amidase [Brucella sp. IR073]|uniref:N-acetylmuramoyl-L-alanine amidase n=1 Tax=unclassified Brucella TaxID=2632610 RepID=UPI003B981AA3
MSSGDNSIEDEAGTINIWVPDADNPGGGQLAYNEWHVFQASYTRGGKPVSRAPLTWTLLTSSGTIILATTNGTTGADGTMTNALRGVNAGAGQVRVTADNTSDSSDWIAVVFGPVNSGVPGQGSMVVTSADGQTLSLASKHQLSVTYRDSGGNLIQDGTEVTWTAYPSNRLTFFDDQGNVTNKSKTVNGVATIKIKAQGGNAIDVIPLAVITTSAVNPVSGVHDHADKDLEVGFQVSPDMYPIEYHKYRSIVSYNRHIQFLVMHYTAENFADSIKSLTQDVSVQYLIPQLDDDSYKNAGFVNIQIFNLVSETERAWHAGVSYWKYHSNLNDSAIGIENVNLATDQYFPPFDPQQMAALKQLSLNILQRYPDITPTHVVAHSDIAWARKSDPGPQFPWKDFYEAGIGAWYDDDTKQKYIDQFTANGLPERSKLLHTFYTYGYGPPDQFTDAMTDQQYQLLVRAFQLHFRADNYDGVMDVETAATLYALVEKYFG